MWRELNPSEHMGDGAGMLVARRITPSTWPGRRRTWQRWLLRALWFAEFEPGPEISRRLTTNTVYQMGCVVSADSCGEAQKKSKNPRHVFQPARTRRRGD